MKNRFRPFDAKALVAVLAAALLVAAASSVAQAARLKTLSARVSASYQKAFYEAVDLVGSVRGNLEKLLVTGSVPRAKGLLEETSAMANAAQSNLAVLPESVSTGGGALKFVNQVYDFCASLGARLERGERFSDDDYASLETLAEYSSRLLDELSASGASLSGGEDWLADASNEPVYAQNVAVGEEKPSVDYPTLLYDGPFSDGRAPASFTLEGDEVSREQALALAVGFVGADRASSARVTGEIDSPTPAYEVEISSPDGLLSLAVSKTGGKIIYMLVDGRVERPMQTVGACADLAAAFVAGRGLGEMSVSYWMESEGYVTVNFAAVQDGVILYPDLIKAQVSMETGMLVGWEASAYLANHNRRDSLTPALSEPQARAFVAARLNPGEGRLCLIPLDDGEALCYEFSGSYLGNEYLVYIDALDGGERQLYRLTSDASGRLAA